MCPFMTPKHSEFVNPTNGQVIKPNIYVNCQTCNVLFTLVRSCPKVYVGQTTQKFKKRIHQHLSTIRLASHDLAHGKTLTSVAAHFVHHHQMKSKGLQVFGMDKVSTNIRGGDVVHLLLRKETQWIFEIDTMNPGSLNEELLFTGYYGKG